MIDQVLIAKLLELVQLATSGAISIQQFAKLLIELALETGIAPAILSEYLTPTGIKRAEAIGDIAEEAKMAVKRMSGE